MVISYQGPHIIKSKEPEHYSMIVADYMATRLVTFRPEQSMFDAVDLLIKHRISGGPVVNDDNELVGVLSEGDCLKEVVKGKYNNMLILSGQVSDHMATNVISIAPETNIFEAANMFLTRRLRRFPVVRGGKLIGQISQKDIMKAVLKMNSSNWR
ncbi:MAG: CBS domain-containing protein [Cyclobacteriaceae bacterium]|tara:strand:+ start:81 stop:545 length:465 start_codon:yes stop_codon:yes gene_type:complete